MNSQDNREKIGIIHITLITLIRSWRKPRFLPSRSFSEGKIIDFVMVINVVLQIHQANEVALRYYD